MNFNEVITLGYKEVILVSQEKVWFVCDVFELIFIGHKNTSYDPFDEVNVLLTVADRDKILENRKSAIH